MNADFQEKYDLYQKLAADHGFAHSNWSIYEVTDFTQVPFPNANRLLYAEYSVEVALDLASTWLDLWKAADRAIQESLDCHHIFIEGFDVDGDSLVLVTGS